MLNYKQREKIAGWVYKWRELSNKLFEIKKIIPEEYSKEFSEALNESISLKMSQLLQKILSETKKDNTTDQEHFDWINNMFDAENIASIKGKGSKSFEEWKKKQTLKEYFESYDEPLNEGILDTVKNKASNLLQKVAEKIYYKSMSRLNQENKKKLDGYCREMLFPKTREMLGNASSKEEKKEIVRNAYSSINEYYKYLLKEQKTEKEEFMSNLTPEERRKLKTFMFMEKFMPKPNLDYMKQEANYINNETIKKYRQ